MNQSGLVSENHVGGVFVWHRFHSQKGCQISSYGEAAQSKTLLRYEIMYKLIHCMFIPGENLMDN